MVNWEHHSMFGLFKKLKKKEVEKEPDIDSELVDEFMFMSHDDNIVNILFNPSSKLYIINTYTDNIDELFHVLERKNNSINIIAVNLNSYFGRNPEDMSRKLKSISTYLIKNKPTSKVEHDLRQILDAYHYLKELEES